MAQAGHHVSRDTHLFVEDPTIPADTHLRRWCRCGAREDNNRHLLPPVNTDQKAAEQRRIGDRD